ncbi:MAG: hypothetical protein IJT94_00990 [Oscillibacter sp.]|nr:hypothetical protein [Oscillibacter sp.]
MKFYFTYGSDGRFPFQDGWTEIEAPSYALACAIFREYHPDRDPEVPCLNCADVYPEEQFKGTIEWMQVNYKDRCHERITLTRELLDKKGEGFI